MTVNRWLFQSAGNQLKFSGFSCDRKDQKTLERLRAERQAKIDELKERTNYYTTQQLIQRYDPDPAAKAAAASVLASKLGEDSGLKVYVGDESMLNATTGKSNDVEFVQASGLRNRKQAQTKSSSPGSTTVVHNAEEVMPCSARSEVSQTSELSQLVVEHRDPQSYAKHDGGWIARIAALLVGEDPAQSFALICGNCNMHNGLARKEDFPYISYYCPRCHALNQPKRSDEHATGSPTQSLSSSRSQGSIEAINNANDPAFNTTSDGLVGSDIGKVTEKVALGEPA